MLKTKRWSKTLLSQLKTMYEDGIARGDTKSYLIMEIANDLKFPQNMVQYQIDRLTRGKPKTRAWSNDEIKILKKVELKNNRFDRQAVLKLMPLLPDRSYLNIRSKLYYFLGLQMERTNGKGKVGEEKARREAMEVKTLDQVMLGKDSIYDKAAALIQGTYSGGIITKNGRQLTGKETLELLTRVRLAL